MSVKEAEEFLDIITRGISLSADISVNDFPVKAIVVLLDDDQKELFDIKNGTSNAIGKDYCVLCISSDKEVVCGFQLKPELFMNVPLLPGEDKAMQRDRIAKEYLLSSSAIETVGNLQIQAL